LNQHLEIWSASGNTLSQIQENDANQIIELNYIEIKLITIDNESILTVVWSASGNTLSQIQENDANQIIELN
jgi:hypothetical protein